MLSKDKTDIADLYAIREKVDAILTEHNEKLQTWTDQRAQCTRDIDAATATIAGFDADTPVDVYMAAVDKRDAANARLAAVDRRISALESEDLISLDEYRDMIDRIQTAVTRVDNAAFDRICGLMDQVHAIGEEYQDALAMAQQLMDSLFFDVRPAGPTNVKVEKQRYIVGDLNAALQAHYATREVHRVSRSQPHVTTAKYGTTSTIRAVNDGCDSVEISSNRSVKKYKLISAPKPRKQ